MSTSFVFVLDTLDDFLLQQPTSAIGQVKPVQQSGSVGKPDL